MRQHLDRPFIPTSDLQDFLTTHAPLLAVDTAIPRAEQALRHAMEVACFYAGSCREEAVCRDLQAARIRFLRHLN